MSEEGRFDEYERIRAQHRRLLDRFRAWGASPEQAEDADHFLSWLGPVSPHGPSERDVVEFLWGWVPRKFEGEEDLLDNIRASVARFLDFLTSEGIETGPAMRVAGDRVTFLRRLRSFHTAGSAWFEELGETLDATGMEPFGLLPDGFTWGGIQGPVEAEASDLMKGLLTEAVREGLVDPRAPGWRGLSAVLQMQWLDTPCPAFGGRTPRAAIAAERAEQAPNLPQMLAGLESMQEEGMFRGLPLDEIDHVPPPTGSSESGGWPGAAHADHSHWHGPPRFPRVSLPSEEDLAAAAANAPLLPHLRALLDVIGDGRKLTAKGNLTLADARTLAQALGVGERFDPVIGSRVFRTKSSTEIEAVHLAFRWARAAGLLRVQHGSVLPTRRARALGHRPLEDWTALFQAFVWKLDWPTRRWPQDRVPFWSKDLSALVPRSLEELYGAAGDEPLPLHELSDSLWAALENTYDLSDLTPGQRSNCRGCWPRTCGGRCSHPWSGWARSSSRAALIGRGSRSRWATRRRSGGSCSRSATRSASGPCASHPLGSGPPGG